jgi:hypothetical protein
MYEIEGPCCTPTRPGGRANPARPGRRSCDRASVGPGRAPVSRGAAVAGRPAWPADRIGCRRSLLSVRSAPSGRPFGCGRAAAARCGVAPDPVRVRPRSPSAGTATCRPVDRDRRRRELVPATAGAIGLPFAPPSEVALRCSRSSFPTPPRPTCRPVGPPGLPGGPPSGVSSGWPAGLARRGRSSSGGLRCATRGFGEVSGRVSSFTGCAQLVLRFTGRRPHVVPSFVPRGGSGERAI